MVEGPLDRRELALGANDELSHPLPEDQVSLVQIVNALLRRRRWVFGVPLLAASLAAGVCFVLPNTYTGVTTFVPEAADQGGLSSQLTGLASEFGVALPGGVQQPPQFYVQVLESRQLLDRLLLSRFPDPRAGRVASDSLSLLDLLEVKGDSLGDRMQKGRRKLSHLMSTDVDGETGIVELDVESRYPVLAAEVANTGIRYLDDFNAHTRQSEARVRREFIEGQLRSAQQDLRQAEDSLREFNERNRTWQSSPALAVEEGRLQRQVQLQQELYITLNREYEEAKIDEVNDTPVITVIDSAIAPQVKSGPKRALIVVFVLLLVGVGTTFVAVAADYLQRVRGAPDQHFREFRELIVEARGDLERLSKMLPGRRSD